MKQITIAATTLLFIFGHASAQTKQPLPIFPEAQTVEQEALFFGGQPLEPLGSIPNGTRVTFINEKTGEAIGCHDYQSNTSCPGACPCE